MEFHPEIAAWAVEHPPFQLSHQTTPREARETHEAYAAAIGPGRAVGQVEELWISGPAGPLRLRRYLPANVMASPTLLFLHGGGWVGGGLETHDGLCRELAHGAGCAVVAVDYRLAPEWRFPAAFDDCLAAASYCLAHFADRKGAPPALAIGGDSAGGNLAAAVVQALVRGGERRIAFQLLLYPVTDFRMGGEGFRAVARGLGFSLFEALWCADHYLNSFSDAFDPRASPALASDLSGLPPAFIATAEIDALRSDGETYALSLARAGVRVQLCRYLGVPHGFMSLPPSISPVAAGLADACAALRRALTD